MQLFSSSVHWIKGKPPPSALAGTYGLRVLDGEDKEPGRDRINEDEGPILVHCSYMRAGEIVLEQSEFVDRNLTITELVEQARRFEDLGIKLVGVRISLVSGIR